jgi:hypothetical protein
LLHCVPVQRADGFLWRRAVEHGDGVGLQIRAQTQQCLRGELRGMNAGIEFAAHAGLVASHAEVADQAEAGGLRALASWVVKRCRPRRTSNLQPRHTAPPTVSGVNGADSNATAALDWA